MTTFLTLTLSGSGLVDSLPCITGTIPPAELVQTIFFNPLPWIFLILGLWLAYLFKGIRDLSALRESRKSNDDLSRELHELVDDQSLMLDSLSDDFAVEKQKWSLQVTNRDRLLTDLNRRISKVSEELCHKEKDREKLVATINAKDREIEGLKNDLSPEGALGRRVRELEDSLGEREYRSTSDEQTRFQLENRVNELELELGEKETGIYALEIELSEKEAADLRVLELESLLDSRNTEVNQLQAGRRELENRIDEQKNKIEELEKASDSEAAQVAELQSELKTRDGLGDRIDELEELVGDRERELENMRNDRFELENRINDLEFSASEKDRIIDVLKSDLTEKQGARQLLDEVDAVIEKHDVELNQLREQRETVKAELEEKINELERQLEEKEEQLHEAADGKTEREFEISTLQKELKRGERQENRIDELEIQLGERDRELEHRDKHRFELENRINELESQVTEQANSLFILETELSENRGARQRVEELDVLLEHRDRELNQFRDQRETVRAELEEKIRQLEKKLALSVDSPVKPERRVDENPGYQIRFAEDETGEAEVQSAEESGDDRDGVIQELRDDNARLQNELEENSDLHTKVWELEDGLDRRDKEIEQLKNAVSDRDQVHKRMQDFEWILGERDEDLRVAISENDQLHSRIGDLESVLRDRDKELDGHRFEKDGLAFQLKEQDKELDSIRHELKSEGDRNERIRDLEWLLGERDGEVNHHKARIGELEWLLGERDAELNGIRSERDQAGSREHELHSRIAELEWLLGERDADIGSLRHDKGELDHQLHHQIGELEFLRGEVGGKDELNLRIGELEWLLGERDAELETARRERGEISGKLDSQNEEMKTLREENKKANELRPRLQELDWLLKERDGDLATLRTENKKLQAEANEAISLRSTLEEAHAELEEQTGKADQLKEDLRGEAEEKKQLEDRIRELEWFLGERDSELNILRDEFSAQEGFAGKVVELEDQLENRDREIERLKITLEDSAKPGTDFGEDVKHDDRLGALYRSRPDKVDNLKRIKGIASVLEEKLHNHGIYRFKQIALWNLDQISEFGERLAFRDRIYRDQWIPQALDLHRREYGESLPPQIDLYHKPSPTSTKEKKPTGEAGGKDESTVITPESAFANDPVKMDRNLGPIFSSRPRISDDLTQIPGISGQIATVLNNFGIYRFKQIAFWGPGHLKEFRMLLNINGNADLKKWIIEAGKLHLEKYGEQIKAR